jgi:superfamily II DNA helicase RecQ
LRSAKNQAHGKLHNEKVVHWLPPSASRRSIICHHILYPAMDRTTYKPPDDKNINPALSEMFATTMNLQKPLSPKINRDFMSVLTDYIAPSSLAKTSTTAQMASQFHHSRAIHNLFYSAETFQRDKEGNMLPGPLSVAHQVWSAMGENLSARHHLHPRPTNQRMILTKMHYDLAAKRAYQNPSATASQLQYQAISHASSLESNQHAFVLMGCGTGKSGVYNLQLLCAYMNMSRIPKTMVISPHNSLLEMHKLQSCLYLRGTNLHVTSILPEQVANQQFPSHFDLLFISIHALNDLMMEYSHIVRQWNLQNIFVDEYHNLLGELFRFTSSWQCLRLITSLNVKIMLLSATSEEKLMNTCACFMNLRDYKVIGSTDKYPIPNIRIHIVANENTLRHDTLLKTVVQHCRNVLEKKRDTQSKVHAITMSRKDAEELSDMINSVGLKSMWLTSSLSGQQRSHFLQMWQDGPEQVLVSTFTDGIDNSATEDVIVVGATYSIYSLAQVIGRIRPQRQNFYKATVYIFHSRNYIQLDDQAVVDAISRAIGGKIATERDREAFTNYYKKMFHISGYKSWLQQKDCYRKALFEHFSITSPACQHCTNCSKYNEITKSARQSTMKICQQVNQRDIVKEALHTMLTQCYVCKKTECNGIQCLPGNRCFCCHVATHRGNIHKSSDCPANTAGNKLDTGGKACPSCFVSFSSEIPDRGKTEDHLNNKCPHRKRIKRVLLYGVENANDRGNTARNLLVSALSNPTHWLSVMATNITTINIRK